MTPIRIISWKEDFIDSLGRHILDTCKGDVSRALVIFPHNRPARYLKEYFMRSPELPKPCVLPRICSFMEFTNGISRTMTDMPLRPAKKLDQMGLLFEIVERLHSEGHGLLSSLPLDRKRFFPWGLKLASLMEELLRQDLDPQNLSFLQGEVLDFAAALLEQLSRIYEEYIKELTARDWTTPGLTCRTLVRRINEIPHLMEGRQIFVAGFYALSGAENTLFKTLWSECGAEIIWHADPALASGEKAHWSLTEQKRWLENWQAEAVCNSEESGACDFGKVRFVEGFDRHSQLCELQNELKNTDDSGKVAVILPDTGLLIPVLHHLPEKPINISMGYPLSRTPLFQLVETIFELRENRREDGRCYWRDVVTLIRHPYLKMLEIDGKQPLRQVFRLWEAAIRNGEKFFDPVSAPSLAPAELPCSPEDVEALRLEILRCCITNFAEIKTLSDLADALQALADMLRNRGRSLWKRYLIDAEYLFRLLSSVIPELRNSAVSNDEYPCDILFSVARELCGPERVSFEPDPITGLQVLGMLETRLLRFDTLYILDATEDRLPGTDSFDPLFPDTMRGLLGLPDASERDNVAAYNFYRLFFGAKETVVLYQSGETPGILDTASLRSRFVEQLFWELEQKRGRLITTKDTDTIKTVSFPMSALPGQPPEIPRTPELDQALRDRLAVRGLSPSALDAYLSCPKSFYYRYLTDIRPLREVAEEGDRAELGSLLHTLLEDFFKPWKGKKLVPENINPEDLLGGFTSRLEVSPFYKHMSYDRRLALKMAGRERLSRFMDNLSPTRIVDLERSLKTVFETDGLRIPLKGKIDRVDERQGGTIILDYKTGSLKTPRKDFWDAEDLWERLKAAVPRLDPAPELLDELAGSINSLQLPAYLFMYGAAFGQMPHDAGFVELARDGREQMLFGEEASSEERNRAITEHTPVIIDYLIRHLLFSPTFIPMPGSRCEWCDFRKACGG